jgi:hypothetical protein
LVSLLLKKIINAKENLSTPELRRIYGEVCGFTGIFLMFFFLPQSCWLVYSAVPSPSRQMPSTTCPTPQAQS